MLNQLNRKTIQIIKSEYLNSENTWFLGYSGGKDSTALLKLVFLALYEIKAPSHPVYVIYCDTGVEIPNVRDHAIRSLEMLQREVGKSNLPMNIRIVKPDVNESFFVKVIGRGYPPPTNKFRWCTKRLRVKPVQSVIKSKNGKLNTVLLGIRNGESPERDKTISKHKTDRKYFFQHSESKDSVIFSPIVNYSTEEVWATLDANPFPACINASDLMRLYKDAGSECPILKDPNGAPCGKSRFGCWTCTVVRKDKAVTSLVSEGYEDLAPLLEYRNWLVEIRDLDEYRCQRRRNGAHSLGPMNLYAREGMLQNLLDVRERSGFDLITNEEIRVIKELWKQDKTSKKYMSICEGV